MVSVSRRYVRTIFCSVFSLALFGSISKSLCWADFPISGDSPLKGEAFVDLYLGYNPQSAPQRTRDYVTQAIRSEEPALNLASFGVSFEQEAFRSQLTVQAGTAVDANYNSEPDYGVRYLQQANAGVRLGENLWIDAGIFLSHIGLESWESDKNLVYTRALASDFSPYYQSGARVTWEPTPELSLQLLYLNGWQNISDFSGRNAVGTQLRYELGDATYVAWNTFLGREGDGTRMFHNFILSGSLTERLELGGGFDVGRQGTREGEGWWWSTLLIGRYRLSDQFSLFARSEVYSDPESVIIQTVSGEHFHSSGFSLGFDLSILSGLIWRNEYRGLFATHPVFQGATESSHSAQMIVSAISYRF